MQSKGRTSGTGQPLELHRTYKDAETRERLASEHLPLVRRLCQRYRHSGVQMDDLVQVGSVGLVKAIDKYDPARGTAFLAFAIPVIMGEIKNYFRDHGWAVKIPRKLQKQGMIVERAVEHLTQVGRRSPTIPEIAEATGLSEDEVYDTFEVGKYGRPLSLEAEYAQDGSSDGSTALDYLGARDPNLDGVAEKVDLVNTLRCLTEREKTIIRLKFYAGLSQAEIAGRLGVSQMHVSRLQRNALGKLKVNLCEVQNKVGGVERVGRPHP